MFQSVAMHYEYKGLKTLELIVSNNNQNCLKSKL